MKGGSRDNSPDDNGLQDYKCWLFALELHISHGITILKLSLLWKKKKL